MISRPEIKTKAKKRIRNWQFHNLQDLDIFVLGLEKNKKTHFDRLEKRLEAERLFVNYFEGIDGTKIKLEDYELVPRYRDFFKKNQSDVAQGLTNINYLGHLACSQSHLSIIRNIENMTILLEEDVDICKKFRVRLLEFLSDIEKIDPKWDILLLGFTSAYDQHPYHKLNDQEPMHLGYIVRVHSFIGGWGMLYRGKDVATRLLKLIDPLPWHIDLAISENARLGNLRIYGALPPLALHPGHLRISSWDISQNGDVRLLKSDTNIKVI